MKDFVYLDEVDHLQQEKQGLWYIVENFVVQIFWEIMPSKNRAYLKYLNREARTKKDCLSEGFWPRSPLIFPPCTPWPFSWCCPSAFRSWGRNWRPSCSPGCHGDIIPSSDDLVLPQGTWCRPVGKSSKVIVDRLCSWLNLNKWLEVKATLVHKI